MGEWLIPQSKVSLIHEFIASSNIGDDSRGAIRANVRAKLHLADNEILVGGCGTRDWRKGADLFVQLARTVSSLNRGQKVKFIWVGGGRGTVDFSRFEHDVKLCCLSEVVTSVENCRNPIDYFCAMDIFALTSREDPFPLVMLEAGSLGVPVICFNGSGGGPEFVAEGAGLVAPYLDVPALARQVAVLADDSRLRAKIGATAGRKVEDHYTVVRQAPKLFEIINRELAAAGTG